MEEKKDEKDNKYNPNDYQKSMYSFSVPELAGIAPWDASVQVGILAQNIIDSIIRNYTFKRLGVKNSSDVHIEYNALENKLTLYIPRVWCSMCKNRKAEFSYKNQVYCKGCAEIIKNQQVQTPIAETQVKSEEKAEEKTSDKTKKKSKSV